MTEYQREAWAGLKSRLDVAEQSNKHLSDQLGRFRTSYMRACCHLTFMRQICGIFADLLTSEGKEWWAKVDWPADFPDYVAMLATPGTALNPLPPADAPRPALGQLVGDEFGSMADCGPAADAPAVVEVPK
jgi:hypothetical protein